FERAILAQTLKAPAVKQDSAVKVVCGIDGERPFRTYRTNFIARGADRAPHTTHRTKVIDLKTSFRATQNNLYNARSTHETDDANRGGCAVVDDDRPLEPDLLKRWWFIRLRER